MAPSFKPWSFECLFGARTASLKASGCQSLAEAAEPALAAPAELPAYFKGQLVRVIVADGPKPEAAPETPPPTHTLYRCIQPVSGTDFVSIVDAMPSEAPAEGAAWREVRLTFNKLEDVRQITSYDDLVRLPPGAVKLTPTPGVFRCALAPGKT